jgi:hypothetical protein
MPYDEELATRMRALVGSGPEVKEQPMFGGLAFLIGGNMAVAASSKGGALVRVEREEGERLIATTVAEPMLMRGRPMSGWLRLDAAALEGDALAEWVARGVAYARSLPAK